jgi:hypothetical protein
MVAVLVVGFLANLGITAVDDRFHEPAGDDRTVDVRTPATQGAVR